jgi:hypothetical protein
MMATTMEQRAKFRELRTSGVSREEAQTQAYWNITPIATTQTTPTTPVTPQPIVNAPVDPNTGLSKPLEQTQAPVVPTPAPTPIAPEIKYANNPDWTPVTAEVKPIEPVKTTVASKTEAPIDYNKSQGREGDIQANIKQITTDNPALLKDRNAYNQAFGYDTADQGKKAMLDASFSTGNQVPTASAMYNAIVGKADIPEEQKLTPSYKIAQNRYTKANMFSWMTPSQLANEMKNVKLVEGSQTYEDLKAMNPKLVQDATNLRKVNGGTSNIFTYTNNPDGSTTKVNNLEKTFADDFNDNFGEFIKSMYKVQTPEEIRAIIYTPDVKDAEDKAKSIELDINKIDDALDQVDKDVEAELAWTGATGSRIALEKASRKDKLNTQRASLERNYTTYANKANNLITQNTSVYQTQQTQKQAQNAAMLPFIQDQYKTEQEKIKAEQALNDPQTQIQATMKQFEDLGIVSQWDIGSKLQEFKDSWLTLPEYIKGLRKLYMDKPEYQQILAKKAWEGISYQTIGDKVYKNTNGVLTETGINPNKSETTKPTIQNFGTSDKPDYRQYNTKTGQWDSVSGIGWTTGTTPTGNIVPVVIWDRTVYLDQASSSGFENAITQANTAGSPIFFAKGYRDQVETIKSMANKQGIAFNASNPAETAQKLRTAGHQVADPGKSNHETGMAIDVYADSSMKSWPTPAQEKILNANGWYSGNIPGDAGHFEYRGTQGTSTNTVDKEATLERIRRWQVTDSDLGKIQQKAVTGWWGAEFTEALKKWMKTTLTDTQIKWLATVDDKIQKDTTLDNVNLVSQQKETIKGLLKTDIGSNWFNDIALINAFQKIVDPGVSVKEWDVSLLQSSIALKDRLNPSNLLSQVQAGTKLTPETRKQMLDSTVSIYNAQADFGNDLLQKKYYKLADNYGINLADYGYNYDKIDKSWNTIDVKAKSDFLTSIKSISDALAKWLSWIK